jgi:hypothetical protein
MGKQARIRRSRKSKWKIATNQMLASCADPMCGACRGRGALYDPTRVCGCAVDGFRERYAGRLRSRGWGLEVLVDRGP